MIAELAAKAPQNVILEPARPDFRQMLTHAACSVSMCGYNTALDLLQAGAPSLFITFDEGGEVEQTLRAESLSHFPMMQMLAAMGAKIVLAHYDFGFGVKEKDVEEATRLSPAIARVMIPGGVIVSGQPLVGFQAVVGPAGIAKGRYYFYRT